MKNNNSTKKSNAEKPMLTAVYWLVAYLGCCLILGSIYYSNIQHQKKIDKIFDDYYNEISVINGR